jgi:hypothetical protein
MRFYEHPLLEPDDNPPRRDEDGGHRLIEMPLPHYARVAAAAPPDWDRTNPSHPQHAPEPEEQEKPAPRWRGAARKPAARPAAPKPAPTPKLQPAAPPARVKALDTWVRQQPQRTNEITQSSCTTTISCSACGKSWATTWDHRPDIDELQIERDRVLNGHACEQVRSKGAGRR